ncbi:hypothetical protein D3C81_2212410 [compost metagenome]
MGITRLLMHRPSNSMAKQIAHHGEAVLLGMGLYRMHHIADPVSGDSFFDTKI